MPTQAAGRVTKEEHDVLKRALETYQRVTGDEKAVGILGKIQVADPAKDAEEEAKQKQRLYEAQAELQARVEETEQAVRRARNAAMAEPGAVQPGNPGGGQEAMATERAKAAGKTRHGEEPPTAAPNR